MSGAQLISQQTQKRDFNIPVFASSENHRRYPLYGGEVAVGTAPGLSVGKKKCRFVWNLSS
jgi:hypothetical protein